MGPEIEATEPEDRGLVERRAPNGRAVADDLKRWLKILVVLQVVTALALIGVVVYFGHKTAVATDALCNLRAGQVRQLRQSQDFVTKHPNGGFGFTRAQIDRTIAESIKNIAALDTLDCPAVPILDLGKGGAG